MSNHPKFIETEYFGVYTDENRSNYYTKSLTKRGSVYGERTYRLPGGIMYRQWDPYRSKLGACLHKGIKYWPFKEDSKVLYLGAASGTTVSHVSDICANGYVFSVEISARPFSDLLRLASKRQNIFPIMADARKVREYVHIVPEVDVVYQDIAQRDQAEIFAKNVDVFLRRGGYGLIMVKARSIDVVRDPKDIFKDVEEYLKDSGYKVLQTIRLEPYEKDHIAIIIQKV